ncbi:E3 SUMO-protein ligase RanBP2 isoform X2 [Hyalella azteca]|uniref:Nuclear pore complex protein Nup153 n=1 Tax=Hyalella azteca TaxID=294128 RepID=A0A979FS27_HYAAZ|nr:E3 SUMO-protein ligase RanBP2 isoform X2 [Hyalella azteca]
MLRSKKDVDRHVRDILSKVKSDNERKLRGYNIARFYHNVGEHEIASRYVSEFLAVRPKAIDGHRLLGQILEANGKKEKAVLAYKTAYELGDGQKDLVIKICELYSEVPCDVSVLMHWADEGQRLCPHHEAITKLRSTIISNSSEANSKAKLRDLYLDQIKVNPASAELQSNLVRLYLDWSSEDPNKLQEAYNYVRDVEARRPFTHSLLWYQTIIEVADCHEKQSGNSSSLGVDYHSWVLTALDRLVHLTLCAASSSSVSSIVDSNRESYLTEAANLLQKFDNKLAAVKKLGCGPELEQAMAGQLFFHLAQYVMISAKRTSFPLNPNSVSCLLLHACASPAPDASRHCYLHRLAAYRLSQGYHIVHSLAKDAGTSPTTLLNKVRQQCGNRESKEEAFRAVFGSRVSSDQSYFLHHSGYGEQELAIPSADEAKSFDQTVCVNESSQLREVLWLYLQGILRRASASASQGNNSLNVSNLNSSSVGNTSISSGGGGGGNLNSLMNSALKKNQPYFPHKLFDGLQFATSHLNSAVPDSLSHLDLLAFLAATIYCQLENGACSGSVRSAVCKTSVCSGWLLHTPQQEEWWSAAHDLFVSSSRRSALAKGIGKCRQVVQRGLEAIRLLAGGGISVPLAVHIANCFTHWASCAADEDEVSISEITALEERAEHCWQRVLSLCSRNNANGTSHIPRNQLFETARHGMGSLKLDEVEEEGRLFLAKRLIKSGRRQEALQSLGQLKSPEAAFQRALVYKQQASEMVSAVSGNLSLFTPEQRGQHTLYLTQARDTLYLTLDRLRMPGVDRNHPLNATLSAEMANVERALTSITANLINNSFHEGDGESEVEPLSPIHHGHDLSLGGESIIDGCHAISGTPARGGRAMSTLRVEARPSPERLDAQVRHLTTVQEQTLQNLCEQNSALRTHNAALRETCNTVATQVKENAQLFRSILEQNKSMSMDCYSHILTQVKGISGSVDELVGEVQKLRKEMMEVKSALHKRPDDADGRGDGLPAHPTPPPHQSMLSQLYMGCYAGQVGAAGVPHPLTSHLLPPHSAMLPGHAPHGSPFLPPATLADASYLSSSSAAGVHMSRLLGGVNTSVADPPSPLPSSVSARVHFQDLPALASPLPVASAASSSTLSGILSSPYLGTSSITGSSTSAPHNYQIPLPATSFAGAVPLPLHTPDRSSSLIPTSGLLASVPPPIYSAVTPGNSPHPVSHHGSAVAASSFTASSASPLQTMFLGSAGLVPVTTASVTDAPLTGKIKSIPQRVQKISENGLDNSTAVTEVSGLSNTSNEYYHDDGHDPCPDFVPVVPLPAKVEVHTGEEDEQVLFEDRARLYRIVAKEWKERGTGVIKILHNSPKKSVRVLMRRDQTFKICANHLITPSMLLKKLPKHDNAWLWGAQDYADEQLASETFCCKFKTEEIASRFNRAIIEAKMLATEYMKDTSVSSEVTSAASVTTETLKPLSELFKKAPGSWTCSSCFVVNTAESSRCIACTSPNPSAPFTSAATSSEAAVDLSNAGGFKFGFLSSNSTAASPIFSSVSPAKASGSITFGVSGQAGVKPSPFSTPTPGLFSTPLGNNKPSTEFKKEESSISLFVTPKSEINTPVAASSLSSSSIFNTPNRTSILSTPTLSLPTSSTGVMPSASSLFGTPVTGSVFSVAPSSSLIFSQSTSQVPSVTSAVTTSAVAQSKTLFGGFSFTSAPTMAPPKEQEIKKEEEPIKKPSIFSSFTFGSSNTDSGKSSTFSFKTDGSNSKDAAAQSVAILSNSNINEALTFSALADGSNLQAADVFKTKDLNAFKPQPLFIGKNTSVSGNESSEKVEEYEPEVHFEPVIPLPELVQVKTGEEDEEQLFCERAKLYRWAEATKEWKERGLGDVKILSNENTGKIRLLMRREKTLKICANHYITPDLTISFRSDSDKALSWIANDFAESEVIRENFTIKFKTPELANNFKVKFENAQQMLREKAVPSSTLTEDSKSQDSVTKDASNTKPQSSKSLMDMFKPAAGSWECDTCLLRNNADSVTCASCQSLKPGTSAAEVTVKPSKDAVQTSISFGIPSSASASATSFTPAFKFGLASGPTPAFSFGLPTTSTSTSASLSSAAPANFSFKPTPVVANNENSDTPEATEDKSNFKFGSPEKFEFSFKPRPPRSRDVSHCESEDGVVEEDEGDHLYFEPVVPLPDKVDVITGEEDEEILYCHRAKLFRKAGPEWKERGLGDIKILRHRETGRVRLLMRREQVHKICLNHHLTEAIKLNEKDEKSFYWVAQDYSEDPPSLETFAIRFKTPDIAQAFKKAAADALNGVAAPAAAVNTSVAKSDVQEKSTSKDQADGCVLSSTTQQESSRLALARKLLLPDDFFAFEEAERRCSGCLGCKVDTLPPFLEPETPAGNVLKDFPRDEFPSATTPSFAARSVFGTKASDSVLAKPLFGSTPSVSSASLSFGSAPPARSLFGGANADEQKPSSSLFAGPSVGSLFGGATTPSVSANSVFGGASTTPNSASKGTVFGNLNPSSTGGQTQSPFFGAPSSSSVSGDAPSTTSKPSLFGGASSLAGKTSSALASNSVFSEIATSSSASVFGGSITPSSTSVFGGSITPSSTSVFGGNTTSSTASVFGGSTTSSSASVFGGSTTSSSASIFGGGPAANSGSLFGGISKSGTSLFGAPATSASLFGGSSAFGASTAPTSSSPFSDTSKAGSLFGSLAVTVSAALPSNSSTVFGGATAGTTGGSLFGGASSTEGKGLISFADIPAATEGFASKAPTDMSAWQSKPLFASFNKSNNQSRDDSVDQTQNEEDDSHDPHFEPVIPMPDLIEVKTGEEDLEVVYSHRCKTFRFDNNTKEWKERGLGDIKILYDPSNQKFRILQRREQIHKLAVHHYLLPGQKLTPLASSDTAWCWYAHDFSEVAQGSQEQLAAKFKNSQIAGEFKAKFEECVSKVESLNNSSFSTPADLLKNDSSPASNGGAATAAADTSTKSKLVSGSVQPPKFVESETESSETGEDDEDDDDYIDSSIMFEKSCQLEKRLGENWDDLGTVILRIVYESDSDGARLMATDESDLLLLDHVLTADLAYDDIDECIVSWAALDLSTQPACHVKLRATFQDYDDKEIFIGTLEEGREFANRDGVNEGSCGEPVVRACDPELASVMAQLLKSIKE